MKYHYQYVSASTVRIELIAEDKNEIALLENMKGSTLEDTRLKTLFATALESYVDDSDVTRINFMDFPKVALVSFKKNAQHGEPQNTNI